MKVSIKLIALISCIIYPFNYINACSVLYFFNKEAGKIYVANNEDYWYDVKPYIQIEPESKTEYARLWYGWKDFVQGGINSAGLFFDAATTPKQDNVKGFKNPKGNLGDKILANCKNVKEALDFIESQNVSLADGHFMFGDATGNAVVVEWLDGERKLIWIKNNYLIMTNFLLSDTTKGNYPCSRYNSIVNNISNLEAGSSEVTFLSVSRTIGGAVQLPKMDENGRTGGTLYSTFIDISDMKFILVFKLDNSNLTKLDLRNEFTSTRKRTIKLE